MADVHTPAQRSFNMSRVRGKDTKPELLVRQFLHANGYRFRLHRKDLPGKPDLVLPRHRTVIFVHGCFWHRHEGCRYFVVPKARTEFWMDKIGRNVINDERQQAELRAADWRILVLWECELRPAQRGATLARLLQDLEAGDVTSDHFPLDS